MRYWMRLLLTWTLCAHSVTAAPFKPESGSLVLEETGLDAATTRTLATLRAQSSAAPAQIEEVSAYVRALVTAHRETAKHHFLDAALESMKPWWNAREAPTDALILRAILKQADHRFDAALQDVDAVLSKDPQHAEALLLRATILPVAGRYEVALPAAFALVGRVPELVAVAASANIASLCGREAAAADLLDSVLARSHDAQPRHRQWALLVSAEIDWRRGDRVGARGRFEQAMASGKSTAYLINTYSDFLLEEGDPSKALELLNAAPLSGDVTLRKALAKQQLGEHAAVEDLVVELERVFEGERQLTYGRHLRTEARYFLDLKQDPAQALHLAQMNWAEQKEWADAELLLRAAEATGSESKIQEARATLARHRVPFREPAEKTITGAASSRQTSEP